LSVIESTRVTNRIIYNEKSEGFWTDCLISDSRDRSLYLLQECKPGDRVVCLLVGRSERDFLYTKNPGQRITYGLLLRETYDGTGTYIRIGLFDCRTGEGLWDDASIAKLTIV